jgi:hypothetical protein
MARSLPNRRIKAHSHSRRHTAPFHRLPPPLDVHAAACSTGRDAAGGVTGRDDPDEQVVSTSRPQPQLAVTPDSRATSSTVKPWKPRSWSSWAAAVSAACQDFTLCHENGIGDWDLAFACVRSPLRFSSRLPAGTSRSVKVSAASSIAACARRHAAPAHLADVTAAAARWPRCPYPGRNAAHSSDNATRY